MTLFRIFLVFLMCAFASNAHAYQFEIVALVNQDAITNYTLEQRLDVVLRSSGLPDKPEVRAKLRPQILQSLIDETLQAQYAKQNKIEVTEADFTRMIADLEKQNNIPPGSFQQTLKSKNVPIESAMDQLRARVLMQKIIRRAVLPYVAVSQFEISQAMTRVETRRDKIEYNLSEIVLPFAGETNRQEVKSLAEKLVSEIQGGADFGKIAQQFSISSTAPLGGDVGWVSVDRMESHVLKQISTLAPGEISQPIETDAGFIIYRMNRRFEPEDTVLNVSQLNVSFVKKSAATAALVAGLESAMHAADTCDSFAKLGSELKKNAPANTVTQSGVTSLGQVKLTELSAQLQQKLSGLDAGDKTSFFPLGNQLAMFMICEKKGGSEPAPLDTKKVEEVLKREKLEVETRRFVSDLRKNAYIETRR